MLDVRAIRPDNHPFPFLLYGEWALLGMALFSELTPRLLPRAANLPATALVAILAFGTLGLWLPTRSLGLKLVHVALQLSLILIATRSGVLDFRLFPLLYIVLVLRSCFLFGQWGRLIVTGVSLALFLSVMRDWLRSLDSELPRRVVQRLLPQLIGLRLNLVVMFVMLLVFLLLLMNALLAERERRDELHRINQKLRESAAQIEKLAMAQERTRIAREIHDSLGHALTGLNIQLEGALKLWETQPQQAKQFVAQAKEMGSTALRETRQAVTTLRTTPLPEQDLASAIAPLMEQVQQLIGVTPSLIITVPPLAPSIKLTVYRIVQEALTNVCKHAEADVVSVSVTQQSSSPGSSNLQITVQDNGIGFRPQDNTTGFGLKGIQERATAEGGRCQIDSASGQGCTLQVWLPLSPEAP